MYFHCHLTSGLPRAGQGGNKPSLQSRTVSLQEGRVQGAWLGSGEGWVWDLAEVTCSGTVLVTQMDLSSPVPFFLSLPPLGILRGRTHLGVGLSAGTRPSGLGPGLARDMQGRLGFWEGTEVSTSYGDRGCGAL